MVHKLSILIPVYNEAGTVRELLRRVMAVRFPVEREIIVVDDGSTDGSRQILAQLAPTHMFKFVAHDTNMGKGAAIQTALRHATGDTVVIQDADLELDPRDVPTLLEPVRSGEADACYGSRFLGGLPLRRRLKPAYWANLVLNRLINLLNGTELTDFNTGYKMVSAQCLSRLRISERGFAVEAEITTKLARLGVRIVERPVGYDPRSARAGKKIRPFDLFRYVAAMFRYRFLWSDRKAASAGLGSPEPGLVSV